ncbi:glycosyl hydrolase family 65 protein [Enterococcus nangangensis]|uniref:glycosyl hydrolase family 65 protein n=1 Tax=Enterococcus nangangensis TaxID=2559926 RepID=UPI0010F81B2B|nr:glycosyl hydrolase family 65 protein [Enterococcus nangangensis]
MNHYVVEEGWQAENIVNFGNKFMIGNGYLGVRGTMDEATKTQLCGVNLAGLYDQVGDKWREPVNAPNPFYTQCFFDEESCSTQETVPLKHRQWLDLLQAQHFRQTTFPLADTHTVTVTSRRLASAANVHLLLNVYEVQVTRAGVVRIVTGIDGDVWDINGPHLTNFTKKTETVMSLRCQTQAERQEVALAEKIFVNQPYTAEFVEEEKSIFRCLTVPLAAGATLQIKKVCAIYTDNDETEPLLAAEQAVATMELTDFEAAYQEHLAVWEKRWWLTNVEITGDTTGDLALRYSLYQLQIIAPYHRSGASIPARGLSGQTYKGAIFWDTEMFMLPFFSHYDQELTRNILTYRVKTLPAARKKAASYGFKGAFYAWESQEKGQDATSDYNVIDVFTKRPQRTYFKDKQIHISGDIVYGIWRYQQMTQDWDFLLNGGAEVVLECARFYASYAVYIPEKERYELRDVLGPDEYHERVNNNAYTSKMAKFTLQYAEEVLQSLGSYYPLAYNELLTKLGLVPDLPLMADIAARLYVPIPNATGVIPQFDGYFALEDTTPAVLKTRLLHPKEYWGGAYGVASDTQVIKQADVVMLLTLFGADYTLTEKKANWEYYEPRTEHGSSLSACLYGLLACEIGKSDWAYPYFLKTAAVDLTGESKSYAGDLYIGGTHPAANGGAWMVALRGFCGLRIEKGQPQVTPRLPQAWEKVQFKVQLAGKIYQIVVTATTTTIQEITR